MHEAHIFVVDDDVATRSALDTMLRSVGYQVQLFGSGQELMDALGDGIDACIILDVRLPGPSGLEVHRRLAEKGLATPVIFMTGHGDIPMAVQAMKADAVEFLTKPVRDQDVLDAIDVALQRNRARRARPCPSGRRAPHRHPVAPRTGGVSAAVSGSSDQANRA